MTMENVMREVRMKRVEERRKEDNDREDRKLLEEVESDDTNLLSTPPRTQPAKMQTGKEPWGVGRKKWCQAAKVANRKTWRRWNSQPTSRTFSSCELHKEVQGLFRKVKTF